MSAGGRLQEPKIGKEEEEEAKPRTSQDHVDSLNIIEYDTQKSQITNTNVEDYNDQESKVIQPSE